jgi:hypothetical protein
MDYIELLDHADAVKIFANRYLKDSSGNLLTITDNVNSICARRRIVITSQGRMGLVPEYTRVDDQIFLSKGGNFPFVLRARGKGI